MRTLLRSLLLLVAVALFAPSIARADLQDEKALAEKYSPVVRIVEQTEECGPGEPFEPMDVDRLFDEPTVALRGPWNALDLVKIAPTAKDLVGKYEYHLDFPGNALNPGCGYERWTRRITEGMQPTVYAHVATERDRPGKLALQYWLFYTFNDFNNLHEGDWEMIQLVFDASDAAEALERRPESIGYSSHEGAERADWGDDKLELVGGTHPVVFPAAGSHANKFDEALYLGSSAEAGVGCDDTRGPHDTLRPVVQTIPSDAGAAKSEFPWIAFEGRWGELQEAFFNGPTGPNLKRQWTEPIAWSETWRSRSYAAPTAGIFGTSATDFFCTSVATGSRGLVALLRNPGATLLVLAGLFVVLGWAVTRTRWRPAVPLHLARRRTWGQILAAAGRMYGSRARLFIGLGILFIPLGMVLSLFEALVLGGFGLAGLDTSGEGAGAVALVVVVIGTTAALLALFIVQAATACALVEIDEGREVRALDPFRAALRKTRPLLRGLAVAVGVWVVLSATIFLLPVAIWFAVRWSLLAQVVVLEDLPAGRALRRSAELVHGRWLRVASLVFVGAVLAFAAGPFVGALLILVTDASLPLLNIVAGIVYALAMPFVALTTSYVYFDARVRTELEPEQRVDVLPAEVDLGASA